MSQRRSYYWAGVPYALAGIAFTGWAIHRAEWSWSALGLLPLSVAALGLGQWSAAVTPGLRWTMGTMLFPAIFVLAPIGTSAAVGGVLGLAAGFDRSDSRDFRLGRVCLNAGSLGLAWGIAGLVFEQMKPDPSGPDLGLVAAIVAAYSAHLIVNAVLLSPAVALVFGVRKAAAVPLSLILLGPRVGVLSIATALVASVTVLAGPAFLPVASVGAAVLVAIPVVGSAINSRTSDITASLTKGVHVELLGRAPEELERLLRFARETGFHLRLSTEEVEQVRYLAALFSVTDHYADTMPRTDEQRLDGAQGRSSLLPLLTGLPMEDLGSSLVIEVARAVSIAAGAQQTGDPKADLQRLDSELQEHDVPEAVRLGLVGHRPISSAAERVLQLNPESSLRLLLQHWNSRRG